MPDRLSFAETARLSRREVEGIVACLVRVLGPALRGYPALGLLVAGLLEPGVEVDVPREQCLDVCGELLELASRARHRGRDVDAFALEGVEARLLDALVAPTND